MNNLASIVLVIASSLIAMWTQHYCGVLPVINIRIDSPN